MGRGLNKRGWCAGADYILHAIVVLVFGASSVRGDDTHYRGIPIGSSSIAWAGAFVAVADDAAAAYHNPAGLVGSKTYVFSGSLSLFAFERTELENGYQQEGSNFDLTSSGAREIPLFAAAVLQFGPQDRHGNRRYALAYSIANTGIRPIIGSSSIESVSSDMRLINTYNLNTRDREDYFGLSFAGSLKNSAHRLGITWYLSSRRLEHGEVGIGTEGLDASPQIVASETEVNLRSWHFVYRLGWLYQINPKMKIGLMFQPPGLSLRQTAVVSSQFVSSSTEPFYFPSTRVDARTPIPMELEFGVSYVLNKNIMLAVDGSFHGPVRDRNRVDVPAEVGPQGLGFFFEERTRRRPIGNAAIGADFKITQNVSFQIGALSDLSAAPPIPKGPTRFFVPQINRFGGTASIAFQVGGVDLSLGSTFLLGRGPATGVVLDAQNRLLGYDNTQAISRIGYLHITGATQAAKLAGKATERMFKRKFGLEASE